MIILLKEKLYKSAIIYSQIRMKSMSDTQLPLSSWTSNCSTEIRLIMVHVTW